MTNSVRDVAEFILQKTGRISTWKLQKLAYYAQAWHLVWDDEPLFNEEIQAWANGPVCPELYAIHRGKFNVTTVNGSSDLLSDTSKETVEIVARHYGKLNGQQLSDLTHKEAPWRLSRRGLDEGDRGSAPITHESLAEYYGSLQRQEA